MTIRNTFLVNPEETVVRVPIDGLLQVQVLYEVAGSSKESATSITYRVSTGALPASGILGADTDDVYVRPSTVPSAGVSDVCIQAGSFGQILHTSLVSAMQELQSVDVIYRKVNLISYNSVTWAPFTRSSVPVVGSGRKSQIAFVNSNLQENQVYKFKCTSGATGSNEEEDFIQREAVSIRCYLSGMNSYSDKPSRFIILGTTLKTTREALAAPSLDAISSHLTEGIVVRVANDVPVFFTPVFLVAGSYRPVIVAQIEGVKRVAGSRSRQLLKPDVSSSNVENTGTEGVQGRVPDRETTRQPRRQAGSVPYNPTVQLGNVTPTNNNEGGTNHPAL